jgi:hypothetical protein
MKKPFFTLGALVGAVGLVLLCVGTLGNASMNTGGIVLVAGIALLLVGFFRGESKK